VTPESGGSGGARIIAELKLNLIGRGGGGGLLRTLEGGIALNVGLMCRSWFNHLGE